MICGCADESSNAGSRKFPNSSKSAGGQRRTLSLGIWEPQGIPFPLGSASKLSWPLLPSDAAAEAEVAADAAAAAQGARRYVIP